MMNPRKYVPALALLLLVFSGVACKKSKGTAPDFHHSYAPLEVGKYVIYQVDSMYHDNGQSDTFSWQLKEIITDTYTDNEGETAYRYERLRRDSATGPWVVKDVWSARRKDTRYELVEENQRTVKLIFPVGRNKRWNPNTYNTLGEDEYYYLEAHEPHTYNGMMFDSTATVIQADRNNLVDSIYKEEVYAAGVGLVKKQWRELDFGNFSIGIVGSEYFYTLLEYGM